LAQARRNSTNCRTGWRAAKRSSSPVTAFTATGTLAAAAFHVGAAAADADDRIIYSAATGNLFYDRDGTGAAAAVQFAHLNGSPALSNTDFVIVT
jgi:Ca2+-binding RTX toxin-like protein